MMKMRRPIRLLVAVLRFMSELQARAIGAADAGPGQLPGAHPVPSVHESTIQARRILQLNNIATFSTVFPPSSDTVSPRENRPTDVAAAPIGLMEYYAQCGPEPYNPTILGVTIASTMRNAAAGSNATLSLRYRPPPNAAPVSDPWAYFPANLPRFALVGYLEKLSNETVQEQGIKDCFLKTHPEAAIWQPGSDVHDSWWGRLVVKEFYFFGGFGDRARIGMDLQPMLGWSWLLSVALGWFPIEEWRGITQDEIDAYRLVGEEGYEDRVEELLEL